jgi:hypothetical protein
MRTLIYPALRDSLITLIALILTLIRTSQPQRGLACAFYMVSDSPDRSGDATS